MTSQLQRHFSNNITTLCRRLLIDVFFATLLQRRDMVERRRDLKTTTLQRRHDVVCLLGKSQVTIYLLQWRVCFIQYVSKNETAFNVRLNNHRKDSKKKMQS